MSIVFISSSFHSSKLDASESSMDPSSWSLEDRVGQLFFLGYRDLNQLKEMKPSGVILYSWSFKDALSLRKRVQEIKAFSKKHLKQEPFIAIDHEGGAVLRIKRGIPHFPDASAVAAVRDPDLAFEVGRRMGWQLSSLGIDTNLAPVLDLGNAKSFLKNRVWGSSPEMVAQLTQQYLRGLRSAGIFSVAKHFPGHGVATQVDAHFKLPQFFKSFDKLWKEDFKPFQHLIQDGLEGVMTAHVSVPQVDAERPASLSSRFIKGILRERLNFNGLIVTDDLEMGGAYQEGRHGSVADLAIESLKAGTDIIMVVWSHKKQKRIKEAVVRALRSGLLSEEELNKKVQRILSVKQKYKKYFHERSKERQSLAFSEQNRFIEEIYKKAILWKTENKEILAKKLKKSWKKRWNVILPMGSYARYWKRERPQDKVFLYHKRSSQKELRSLMRRFSEAQSYHDISLVLTRPLIQLPTGLEALLRSHFNQKAKGYAQVERPVIWLHQGPSPVKFKRKVFQSSVGIISLHSGSLRSLQQFFVSTR